MITKHTISKINDRMLALRSLRKMFPKSGLQEIANLLHIGVVLHEDDGFLVRLPATPMALVVPGLELISTVDCTKQELEEAQKEIEYRQEREQKRANAQAWYDSQPQDIKDMVDILGERYIAVA